MGLFSGAVSALGSVSEVFVSFFKMFLRMLPAVSSFAIFSVLLVATTAGVLYPLANSPVLQDIQSLIQMWLPFDLGSMLTFLFSTISTYYAFRLFRIIWSFVVDVTGTN